MYLLYLVSFICHDTSKFNVLVSENYDLYFQIMIHLKGVWQDFHGVYGMLVLMLITHIFLNLLHIFSVCRF